MFAAMPVSNKTGKSYFHSGNLMQHLKRKHPEQHEMLIKSKGRLSPSASSSATLDAFVTVMRPAEKGHVDYTIGVSNFKKAVVEAVTLNRLLWSFGRIVGDDDGRWRKNDLNVVLSDS